MFSVGPVLIVNLLCCTTKNGKFTCSPIFMVSLVIMMVEREISVTVAKR